MNRTFTKIMFFYVAMATIFISFSGITSSALSSHTTDLQAGGWLADLIITGVNYFIKLVMAFI